MSFVGFGRGRIDCRGRLVYEQVDEYESRSKISVAQLPVMEASVPDRNAVIEAKVTAAVELAVEKLSADAAAAKQAANKIRNAAITARRAAVTAEAKKSEEFEAAAAMEARVIASILR